MRDWMRVPLALALTVGLGVCPAADAQSRVDEIVSLVNGRAVTASRVRFMEAFLEVTGGDGMGRPIDMGVLSGAQDVLKVVQEDELILSMSTRLTRRRVSEDQLEERLQWFEGQFSEVQAYKDFVSHWGFSRDNQRRFFEERIRITAFLDVKVGGHVETSERDLRAFYEGRAGQYEGPFEPVRAQVKADYAEVQRHERYREWMDSYLKDHRDAIRTPARTGET